MAGGRGDGGVSEWPTVYLYDKLASARQSPLGHKCVDGLPLLLGLLDLDEATDWVDPDTIVHTGLL